ncbi:MAG: hypothetical protein PW845_19955 [Pseudomonas sp.]|nr:hypothetical protein [Pseudomonas sp.]
MALVVAVFFIIGLTKVVSDDPEIALVIGEPYEAMRKRSSAAIGPAIPGYAWFAVPKSDARLRFNDPQYGFLTPMARFFTVTFDDELIDGVRMSPQVEPLLLDDALNVVLDLQEQWRKAGWTPTRKDFPPIADTPDWRTQLRNKRKNGKTYWHAGDQYQAMLIIGRFHDVKRPDEERYLISLQLATPWVKPLSAHTKFLDHEY